MSHYVGVGGLERGERDTREDFLGEKKKRREEGKKEFALQNFLRALAQLLGSSSPLSSSPFLWKKSGGERVGWVVQKLFWRGEERRQLIFLSYSKSSPLFQQEVENEWLEERERERERRGRKGWKESFVAFLKCPGRERRRRKLKLGSSSSHFFWKGGEKGEKSFQRLH